jgi:hypothetical protein
MEVQEVAKIMPSSVTVYKKSIGRSLSEAQLIALSHNWTSHEYNGFMSKETRVKVLNMLSAWQEAIYVHSEERKSAGKPQQHKLRFLTLTLSKQTDLNDNDIKRLALVPFIQELKRQFNVVHYFWRAEAQKCGRIHFHLIVDKWLDKNVVNYIWDKAQNLAGITEIEPIWKPTYSSPSTRIEVIKGGESAFEYVVKYVSKDEGVRKIDGRIWGCSDGLRNITVPTVKVDVQLAKELTQLIDDQQSKVLEYDYARIYMIDVLRQKTTKANHLLYDMVYYYSDVYNYLYTNNIHNLDEKIKY